LNRAEVALIHGKYPPDSEAIRRGNHRGVGQAQLEIGISLKQDPASMHIGGRERLERERSNRNIVEKA
jgi:hypothetical protein